MNRGALQTAVLGAVLVLPGCGKSPPPLTEVEGVVTINGQPLPRAEVTFLPLVEGFGGEIMSTAVTDDNGRFRLTCGDKPGACACAHKVTVAEGPLPDELRGMSAAAQTGAGRYLAGLKNRPIPDRYTTFAQTPLTVTVTPGQKEYQIALTR